MSHRVDSSHNASACDRRNTFWTGTIEAALVRWMQPDEELPSWEEAHKRLQQEGQTSPGRASRVK